MNQMTYFDEKITAFYKKHPGPIKRALEKIIHTMIDKCRYINGESLERHNWGNRPIKLNNIPKDIRSSSFEEELLNALNLEDNEKSIVELLWGDIQLGKRVHACIIMWISVHILKRPVLYIFRNLTIDQKQLQDDITGTENYNFNIQFIKNIFTEFNKEISEYFQETDEEYHKEYRLPGLKDINSDSNIDKLSSKEGMDAKDIFCCLMNHSALAKINTKFSQYIHYNNELVDITVLVDESDLLSPTSSNDRTNDNDKKDSTICEILLAKIYKKVKYALQITGTAHSLLYNVTTRLSDHTDIQIKISKVHKMIRADDYYGLFNDKISFNTTLVQPWWDYKDDDNKKNVYDIGNDYNINIKKIIDFILYKRPILNQISKKPNQKYNSLLISEEKTRTEQFSLVKKIIKDFPDLFIIIYHGNCLRLYLSKQYEKEIKRLSQWDAQQSMSSQRLHQPGGVYGSSIDTEKYEKLPNNYCYFNIDTKILNIKLVYKLLRVLFEKSDTHITYKTIITITGKYGERGYSFTSDDYDNYSLHLTDQYFVSHASLNCTNESQEMRISLKSNDIELKNGTTKLMLWTTPLLQDVMQNFYVKFIKEIEKYIMTCKSWEEIKDLLESIIDNGDFKFGKYMKYIDVSKKRKNLKPMKHYDAKNKGYKLIVADGMSDTEISEWCKETGLPEYTCINTIEEMDIDEFKDKYGSEWDINTIFDLTIDELNEELKNRGKEEHKPNKNENGQYICCLANENLKVWEYDELAKQLMGYGKNSTHGIHNGLKSNKKYATRSWVCYNKNGEVRYIFKVGEKIKIKKNLPVNSNNYIKKTPYVVDGNKVKYSVLKEKYKQNIVDGYINEEGDNFIEDDGTALPDKYYWKTPDGWLYYYDKDKPEIISLNIVAPLPSTNVLQAIVSTQTLLNPDIVLFAEQCCKKTNTPNLRFGLKEIYVSYETWCKINNKKTLKTQKKFKEEFEKLNYKEETSKGVDINNNSGKRGYNIMVKL